MTRLLTTLLFVCLLGAAPAWATTYYIDNAGSDSANGTSASTPWLHWSHAFVTMAGGGCGHTLIVMDGTYTPAVNGNPVLTKVCTVGNVFTIQAQNQRAAFISGTGAAESFNVLNSAYVVVDDLRVRSADLASGSGGHDVYVVQIRNSNHVTFKNGIVSHNNRYFVSSHLIGLHNATDRNSEMVCEAG